MTTLKAPPLHVSPCLLILNLDFMAPSFYAKCKQVAFFAFCIFGSGNLCAQEVVRYALPPSTKSPYIDYALKVLDLSIKKSGHSYVLAGSISRMPQSRVINNMMSPQGSVDVIWTMTSVERAHQMLAIKIPIDKGLLGWRIALIRAKDKDLLKGVNTLKDLQKFSAGQGHDWPDTDIMRSNGIPVVTGTLYEALFNMLKGERFDYFPRSVLEIEKELIDHPQHDLAIDQHIILHYPTAMYFFVTPRRPDLARDLKIGLERAIADGSFEKLFQESFGQRLKNAHLKQRHLIEISNPMLNNESLPDKNRALWHHR